MTKLKTIRKVVKLSTAEVARNLGVSPQTVRWQERNGINKKSTAERYARILKCHWTDLID